MAERRPVTYPVTVDPIGKLYDLHMRAFMYCRSCKRSGDIDLPKLIERVGRDWFEMGRLRVRRLLMRLAVAVAMVEAHINILF